MTKTQNSKFKTQNSSWMPPNFAYNLGELWVEGVRLNEIAAQFGTPCYVYSANSIRAAYQRYQSAFAAASLDLTLCYAVKANSNLAILRLLGQMGAGADVVSAGELYRALQAGIEPAKIVFAGVGKTAAEIDFALDKGIKAFNIESAGEMALIQARALIRNLPPKSVGVSIRVNPDVAAETHPYITTGKHNNKFGLAVPEARKLALEIAASEVLHLRGLQMHIGSQLLTVTPIVEAFRRLLALAGEVENASGQKLEYLDIGGGLGVCYSGETPEQPAELAAAIAKVLTDNEQSYPLVTEPGRYLVGEAGTLLTEVLYLKANEGINFAIVDAAMNDLIRPALYQATHKIVPLKNADGETTTENYEVVGPICESGDWLGHNVPLPDLQAGTKLAILSAGAYGFTMASNYNSRPRPPEILVDGTQIQLIRRRETFDDLLAAERV